MKGRNCFSTAIVEDDSFLDMPMEAQLLYFHATAHADADGRIVGVARVVRSYGISALHLHELYDAGLFLDVDGQTYVTHHWQNNGYDGRFFERTMQRCEPYMTGRLKFAGETGKSRYVLSDVDAPTKRRQNDADMIGSDVMCADDDLICFGSGYESEKLGDGGLQGGGTSNGAEQAAEAMTPTEHQCLTNYVDALVKQGFDAESTRAFLLDAYNDGGNEKMFGEYVRLCGSA